MVLINKAMPLGDPAEERVKLKFFKGGPFLSSTGWCWGLLPQREGSSFLPPLPPTLPPVES